MQRYFVAPEQFVGQRVTIGGDDAHHLQRVMRAEPGDQLIVCDGNGRTALASIASLAKTEVVADIVREVEESREADVDIWIAQSLPKGDKLETVIQKGTELGASRFIPFESERTVAYYDGKKEEKKLERWRKIAKEAAEQAHRSRLPVIEAPCGWKRLLEAAGQADLALICYEKQDEKSLRSLLREWAQTEGAAQTGTVLVIVGPEGGFAEREIREAAEADCRPVSLGRRILRTETAALVALSCILYETGEMGG
ncbi:16S rRNA (uracil(1498)-N(3))-methyltransferase [Paenibacillus cymbidii]|uniref:16S rRNA (uracil(1498)-N(3))-methyltransferase n=1 Tax=Paenibacillus cymbidii TaxID=1639034 RepID=UPI001082020C|nr:16S rRNA (uracil(1498)-N(3))-methyltransferase [Paenibacillus cymbidii]